jgi:hypothetical protein
MERPGGAEMKDHADKTSAAPVTTSLDLFISSWELPAWQAAARSFRGRCG